MNTNRNRNKNVIERVTAEGVMYTDEEGETQFIDFEECNENWLDGRKSPAKWERRCVGVSDTTRHPIYVDLFTRPITRFEFDTAAQAHDQLLIPMRAAGRWTTLQQKGE